MSKVLITGGAGFIGSNLARAYLAKGYEVIIVDNLSTGKLSNVPENVTLYEEDIRSSNFIDIVKEEQPDVINHHAAQIDVQLSIKNPAEDASINILGTINVLEAVKMINETKECRLVYPSSAAVYGEPQYLGVDEVHPIKPISFYGASKFTPEFYIQVYHQLHNIPYTIFRYANVFGIGQDPKGEGGVISILVDKIVNNELFTVFGDGEQTRDFIYVEDIVSANLIASEKPINTVVNISTNTKISLNELINVAEGVINSKIETKYAEERSGDIKHSYLNNKKANEQLGWYPAFTLEQGLLKTIEYYKNK
ncbi:GDP-mannose 4,6-dehydratase [Gottfriedia luciferensis]|uniref:GDP-mannose 4,6-dehydratase n=1 Tax=Gottfriedia luciferensis TaxID=178774 RepID=UPI000B44953F|nr:GDP-mannose 4,6-dehydratase [Gottfriedia luciferensis]